MRYNLFSFSAGIVLALLPTGYVWLENRLVGYTIFTFALVFLAFYLAIRLIDKLLNWLTAVSFLAAFGTIAWAIYHWLREAKWPDLNVADAISQLGITPTFVFIEGWVGVSKIINSFYLWLLELSLPADLFLAGTLVGSIALVIEYLDVPKMEEEEFED